MNTRYLVAKYIPDPMRMEPRNVGVICLRGNDRSARFLGESAPGAVDGRRLRGFEFPDVYRQWVTYWRYALAAQQSEEALQSLGGANYQIVNGGEVAEVGSDSTEIVVDYLYALLVSEGGFREAINNVQEAEPEAVVLRDELAMIFAQNSLLASAEDSPPLIQYPIRRNVEVAGARVLNHRPAFVQQNGLVAVIETIDFTGASKERSKDHAGLVGYMFEDLRKKLHDGCDPISVIRASDQDREVKTVQYALSILSSESRVVDWFSQDERAAFVEERRRVALGA